MRTREKKRSRAVCRRAVTQEKKKDGTASRGNDGERKKTPRLVGKKDKEVGPELAGKP